MPIYEYQCEKCRNVFDMIRSMSAADDPIACEDCGCEQTKRMLSKCYAHTQSGSLTGQSNACAGCAGGSCASCGH